MRGQDKMGVLHCPRWPSIILTLAFLLSWSVMRSATAQEPGAEPEESQAPKEPASKSGETKEKGAAPSKGFDPAVVSAGTAAEKTEPTPSPSDTPSLSTFATLSPQWRGGNDHLQNSGFGPLAWVGASWQSKVLSARVTVCVACHGVQEQAFLSRVDIVE